MGILFGALFGAVQALLVFDVQYVAGAVFPEHDGHKASKLVQWFPSLAHLHFQWPQRRPRSSARPCRCIMALRGLCSYLNSYYMLWVSVRVLDDIRQQVFRHTLGQSMEFFNQSKAGELVQTVFNQTRMAQQALTSISSDLVKQPITIITGLATLFALDWRFTLTSFIIFPLCLLPVVFVSRKVRKAGAREEEEASMLMVVMQEAFAGIRVVKTHAREDFESQRFNQANWEIMRHMIRWRKAIELNGPAVETIASLGVGAALIWAWHFHLPSKTFYALTAGLSVLYPAFKAISRIQLTMQKVSRFHDEGI